MITRIVLKNGAELDNVINVSERLEYSNDFVYKYLAIELNSRDESNSITVLDVHDVLSQQGVLDTIKIYQKDEISRELDEETGDEIIEYGDEYLNFQSSEYSEIRDIHNSLNLNSIVINLRAVSTTLSDVKYNELVEANEYLRGIIDVLLGGEDNE